MFVTLFVFGCYDTFAKWLLISDYLKLRPECKCIGGF